MNALTKRFFVIYLVLLTVNIVGGLTALGILSVLTKPALMPTLILAIWADKENFNGHLLIILALIFSLAGDVFLMFSRPDFFIYGLGSFLLAHLFYILIFLKDYNFQWIRLLPFLAYIAMIMLGPLYGKIPADLQLPVYIYISVITIMGITAALRTSQTKGYDLILIGAVLFILSDSFIAVNKFSNLIPASGFWVMITYGMAQFFIVWGYLLRNFDKNAE